MSWSRGERPSGTCSETVDKDHGESMIGNYQWCGRKILVGDSDELCSMHRTVKDRREAKQVRWEKERKEDQKRKADAQRYVDYLSSAFGVETSPYFNVGFGNALGKYTGEIVIKPEDVDRLINWGIEDGR